MIASVRRIAAKIDVPRPLRIALYLGALAALASLVADGDLPAWAAAFAGPPLLALLHLNPKDVESSDE